MPVFFENPWNKLTSNDAMFFFFEAVFFTIFWWD